MCLHEFTRQVHVEAVDLFLKAKNERMKNKWDHPVWVFLSTHHLPAVRRRENDTCADDRQGPMEDPAPERVAG